MTFDLLLVSDISPLIPPVAGGILGLVVGSFLNVVIRRLPVILERRWLAETRADETAVAPEPLSLILPPSHCFACRRRLKAWHKIPLLSYLLLGGRCGFCKTRISIQYPTVELITLIISMITVAHFGVSWQSLSALLLVWTLIVLFFIDHNEQLLPDELTLGLLWAGLIANAFSLFIDPASSILGAAAGYAVLWLIYHGMRLITGRQGLGYGDMKLLAAIGAWCGWQALPFVMLIASTTGLFVGIVLLATHKMRKNEHLPFGPYLTTAGWLLFIYVSAYQWRLPQNLVNDLPSLW